MKITVIGAGNVGATCAMRLLEQGLGDIVLIDIIESLAKGKAEDLMDAASIIGHNCNITGTSDYSLTEGSDIVVVTAGFARQPGMSREELLSKNASIVREVAKNIKKHSGSPIIIVVTNPLDIMAYLTYKETGFDSKRVIGMAGFLDSSRMNLMIARQLNRNVSGIDSMVMGTHGKTMVPAVSNSKVDKAKLADSLKQADIDKLAEKTKARGAEIVSYLGKGSAFYAPSAGVLKMAQAIAKDTNEILPCSSYLNGEYDIKGIYLGVPARIGTSGITEIVKLTLTKEEEKLLKEASESVQSQISSLK
ncbi:MAG: malate dehydrogenase [Candidatus Omnitrophica bacterium]|nr:malate dehydrogenase [Candidatus Omnitrophota bacterium]